MDVNEQVIAEWVDETTPYDRVHEVMRHSYEPRPLSDIAATAHVSESETEEYLTKMENEGFVHHVDEEKWTRNWESVVDEQARDILDRVDDREVLLERVHEMEAMDEPDETTRRNLVFARAALNLQQEGNK